MPETLERLVDALPEIYQPIFGHPEFSSRVSRVCEDRLGDIAKVYGKLASHLGRPLRVLDLGCAQGYFCLSLAKMGATTLGIDFDARNISVCRLLAGDAPNLRCSFEVARIEDALARLQAGEFDLVLGLSVFHHLAHQYGAASVQKMLADASNKITAALFELALDSEPPSWAVSQPANPKKILAGFGFMTEISRHPTHLSDIERPLYFASNRVWLLNGRVEGFDRWTRQSHCYDSGLKQGTRSYFFSGGLFAKHFMLDHESCREDNLRDHLNEVAFLSGPPEGFHAPKLVLHGRTESEAWCVRERVPGDLLSDLITMGKSYNEPAVIEDVVTQLAVLEANGLFHDDVRTWNVIVGGDGRATLIDYGAISKKDADCRWPFNRFLAFFTFLSETINRRVIDTSAIRFPAFNPQTFGETYRTALFRFFELPQSEWSYAVLRDELLGAGHSADRPSKLAQSGVGTILQASDEALHLLLYEIKLLRERAQHLEDKVKLVEFEKCA